MTYQRDPELLPEDPVIRREDAARRDAEIARANAQANNGSGFMPAVLAVLVVLGVGYFAYTYMNAGTEPLVPRTTESTAPPAVIPAPAPTVTPAAPETK